MKEVLPGVFTWAWPSPEKKLDFNGWYLKAADGHAIVDPPPCEESVFAAIEEMGELKAILLTNKDHTRRAEEFAERLRVPILIHSADAPLVSSSVRIGGLFRHGDELPGGLEAVRVADAKSPGECAFLLRRANAIIIGDALIGNPAGQLTMLPPAKFPDFDKAREGVRAILKLPFDGVLVGDGTPIPRGGRKALEEFLNRSAR